VLAPPEGLTDDVVASVLRDAWGLTPATLEYAPVGFGSHHWLTGDHFVTIDVLATTARLDAALRTARALHDDAGLRFVIAAIPSANGALTAPVADSWTMHVYERLEVIDDTDFGPHDGPEALDLVEQIHAATASVGHLANREDFAIANRPALEEALDHLDEPWDAGPFGERARRLLRTHAEDTAALVVLHDRLVAEVDPAGWVVTHGEPHRGNVFQTTRGWAVVDWDTALLAPAERDLWSLAAGRGGPSLSMLYRLRWDLCDIAGYVAGFRAPHPGDANDAKAWEGLLEHIHLRS